jgi:hypothetical protein
LRRSCHPRRSASFSPIRRPTWLQVVAPFGLGGLYADGDAEPALRRYLAQPVAVYLGGEDIGDHDLNQSKRAMGRARPASNAASTSTSKAGCSPPLSIGPSTGGWSNCPACPQIEDDKAWIRAAACASG